MCDDHRPIRRLSDFLLANSWCYWLVWNKLTLLLKTLKCHEYMHMVKEESSLKIITGLLYFKTSCVYFAMPKHMRFRFMDVIWHLRNCQSNLQSGFYLSCLVCYAAQLLLRSLFLQYLSIPPDKLWSPIVHTIRKEFLSLRSWCNICTHTARSSLAPSVWFAISLRW